jgi:hypothetical protein
MELDRRQRVFQELDIDLRWEISPMTEKHLTTRFAAALAALCLAASAASAASNISNSLTGFTGNSTQAATQNALAAAGLGFTSTAGLGEDPPGSGDFFDPTVAFDASGAGFGTLIPSDAGRNFIRTTATDYANHSFVAEVTWVTFDMFSQAGYFGLGSAEYGFFRIADWGTPFSAAHLFMEVDPIEPEVFTLNNDNGDAQFSPALAVTGLDTGTNRLRLTYNWYLKKATFAIDVAYAGGPFTADFTAPAVSTINLYGADGWPSEPARVYFGGDDGTVYKDLNITLSAGPLVFGDFNSSGTVTSADWITLRTNQHTNISALTDAQAYAAGDLNGDKLNNHDDFKLFKVLFDAANGVGAFEVMLASIPEPATGAMSLAALLAVAAARRRTIRD